MCLDKIGKYLSELILLFQCGYLSLLVREKRRERVEVVVVDFRDVWIGDDDEWQVSQRLYSGC